MERYLSLRHTPQHRADCTGINLSSLVPQLDSTASEIVSNQRDALVERKDVAQKTKDFRKLDDAGKLWEYKALLKCKSETRMPDLC